MSILVVGSVALDSIETPFGKVENALGGSATYFSVSASFLCATKLSDRNRSAISVRKYAFCRRGFHTQTIYPPDLRMGRPHTARTPARTTSGYRTAERSAKCCSYRTLQRGDILIEGVQ